LAKLSGVSKATISELEANKHDTTVKTLCMVAEALGGRLDDIVKKNKIKFTLKYFS